MWLIRVEILKKRPGHFLFVNNALEIKFHISDKFLYAALTLEHIILGRCGTVRNQYPMRIVTGVSRLYARQYEDTANNFDEVFHYPGLS